MDFLEIFLNIVGVLLVIFVGINVWATKVLYGFARDSQFKYPALNERAISAGIKTAGSAILGVLGINRIIPWHLPVEVVLVLLMVAMILHSLPPVVWVYYYKTGRFNTTLKQLGVSSKDD